LSPVRLGLGALAVALAVAAAACGGGGGTAAPATTQAPAGTTEASTTPATSSPAETGGATEGGNFESRCGLGNGQAASGEPLKIGSIYSNAGGINFSSAAKAAQALINCVNANGGIQGRPIQFITENDQLDPAKAGQVAAKLISTDQVVALVANTSFVDCAVNGKLYQQKGYNIIYGVGIPFQCFQSPPFAATNEGPRYSGMGAAQYAVTQLGAKKLSVVTCNIPNVGDYTLTGIQAYAKQAGVDYSGFTENCPVKDPNSVAVRVANAAGSDGAVVLVMPVPEDVAVLNAADSAGVASTTKWTCATPCNDLSFPGAVSDYWKNGTIFVNSELNLTDSTGPDNQMWLQVMDKYGKPDDPRDNFSQAGFLAAKILVDTMEKLDPSQLTQQGINAAIKEIKNYKNDLECKPYYYGPGPNHVPNNTDRTVVLQGDKFVLAQDCTEMPAADEILPVVRQQEQELGLNTG
jgi:branched-chain amino acid transport system substrate-binding protein